MNKAKAIIRFILGGFTGVASICLLVATIYLLSDYEKNIIFRVKRESILLNDILLFVEARAHK
jgi:nucleoside permease NupC